MLKKYHRKIVLSLFRFFFLTVSLPTHTHKHTHKHPHTMSAADLPAIKADLERALAEGTTFSKLTPLQARLDAVDAARYKTTPPDMTNIADVDECYGEKRGGKRRRRGGKLRRICFASVPPRNHTKPGFSGPHRPRPREAGVRLGRCDGGMGAEGRALWSVGREKIESFFFAPSRFFAADAIFFFFHHRPPPPRRTPSKPLF